jgi:hypothetical protein
MQRILAGDFRMISAAMEAQIPACASRYFVRSRPFDTPGGDARCRRLDRVVGRSHDV